MSTIPSRTRSLRKPGETSSRYGRVPASDTAEGVTERKPVAERTAQSPSRLPVKPPSRVTTTNRPPSSADSVTSNASMRPPPSRSIVSKPTTGGLQRSSSLRRAANEASTDPVKQDRSRPPLTQSKHLRNASASSFAPSSRVPSHTRNKSSSQVLGGSTALRPPSRDTSNAPTPHEPQLRRPAFSTLQQHFSPAKSLAPKPHPAAFLAPPSPSKLPSNIAISAETAKSQNELLQLHILHKDAYSVDQEWRSSAKRKLAARFQSVVDKNDDLVGLELQETSKINASALKQWQNGGIPGWGLEEKIQILDEVVTGVWSLSDSSGKYSRVIGKFERWLNRSQVILAARDPKDKGLGDEIEFIEELDAGWKDDCLLLERKLEDWDTRLLDLGPPPGNRGSSLSAVVEGFGKIVKGMLAELNTMTSIEEDLVTKEAEWIRKMNDDVMNDDNDGKPTAGAIWRAR